MRDDVAEMTARIESLASKEAPPARADTLKRAAKLLEAERPELAAHFRELAGSGSPPAVLRFVLPEVPADPEALQRLVEAVEQNGDDPAAYDALAGVIRREQLSAGLDNPSIRARIALADLRDLLDPVLTALDGTQTRLSDYRSNTVVLAFWATWCVPCRAELSRLEKETAAVLAISWEPLDTVRAFVKEHPYKLRFLIDPGHKLSDHLHIETLPAIVTLRAGGAQTCQPPPRAR